METTTIHRVGIILNGVTGRMGANQHLLRSIVAIQGQGGVRISASEEIMPEVILVGRNPAKLAALSAQAGDAAWTTNLDEPLGDPQYTVYFDAQTTDRRVAAVTKAIAAGKHIYCEKPTATTTAEALELYRRARAGGVKNGVVQDKLWLPGLLKLKLLRDTGFFGQILSIRGEFGYWVFEGDTVPGQRPSWNYRKEEGGGIIIDMLCHFRYVLDNLFGEVQAVSCRARRTSAAVGTKTAALTTARPTMQPTPPSSSMTASSRTSTPAGVFASAATICSCCKWTAPGAVPWPACATVGCSPTPPRRVPRGTPTWTAR